MTVSPINIDDICNKSWIFIFRNISERIKAENILKESDLRLKQAQKMEALGTLAGGIAHDFNNTLTPIIGYAEMTIMKMDENNHLREYMNQILHAADRAKRLVSQILNFSRKNEFQAVANVKISHIAAEVVKMLSATLPSTIKTLLTIRTKEDVVLADPTQIHQIMMNLCTNSAHAMKNRKGSLEIILKDSDNTICGWSDDSVLDGNNFLEIIVKDDGHGIEQNVLPRIFDPFFTTKAPGEGSGMGLSVVHGIIKNMNGSISVETEYGKGTAFHIYMPKASNNPNSEGIDKNEKVPVETKLKKILFIDDEACIANMAGNMLIHIGHDVTVKTDGIEALREFKVSPDKFDIVITDQTMPGMTGLEIAAEMLAIKTDLKIILTSGHNDEITEEKLKKIGIRHYIMKPFGRKEICDAIMSSTHLRAS